MHGGWSWDDGSTWSYTNWGPNEPNNLNDGEDCIITNWFDNLGGQWNDASCNHVANTLCFIKINWSKQIHLLMLTHNLRSILFIMT